MLSDFLGNSALVRIIDFLEMHQEFDYTKAEIARNTGLSKATLYQNWGVLEKTGIVTETRRIGNGVLFKFNTENPLAISLEKFSNAIDLAFLKAEKRSQGKNLKQEIRIKN